MTNPLDELYELYKQGLLSEASYLAFGGDFVGRDKIGENQFNALRDINIHHHATPAPQPPPPRPTADEWPHSYLAEIQRKCQLSGEHGRHRPSALKWARPCRTFLQAIFTSLDVERDYKQVERLLRQMGHLVKEEEREKLRRQPVLEAISQHPKLVLKGAPGAGKSTLVRYIALCLAGEALGEGQTNAALLAEQGWQLSALLPVHVILRDYAARGLPAKQNLWQFITSELQEGELPRCVAPLEAHLKTQGGLLLLDGLDEVPEPNERREALQKAIEQFERDFPKVRILVTTRPLCLRQKVAADPI